MVDVSFLWARMAIAIARIFELTNDLTNDSLKFAGLGDHVATSTASLLLMKAAM